MKLTINRQVLLKLLNFAGQVIPPKSAEIQFRNFVIAVNDTSLYIIASDGSSSAKIVQEFKDEKGREVVINAKPGSTQTDAKTLIGVISAFSSNDVMLETIDSYLVISSTSGEGSIKLPTLDVKDYPDVVVDVPEDYKGYKVSMKDVNALYNATQFSAATKGDREILYGININGSEDKLTFAASDSTRMSMYSVAANGDSEQFEFTCPMKTLNMLLRSNETEDCTIYLDDRRVMIQFGQSLIASNLYVGDFPMVRNIIPTDFKYTVSFEKTEFEAIGKLLKSVMPLDDVPKVKLTMTKDKKVTLSTAETNRGDGSFPLFIKDVVMPEGEEIFSICFNLDYVLSAISALEDNLVTLKFRGQTGLFRVADSNPDNIQVIAPVRMG